jgi:hypothetical protein
LKRLIPILMTLFVMVCTGPHSQCICSPSASNINLSIEQKHSCCKEENVPECDSGNLSFGTRKNCCEMNSYNLPVTTSNLCLTSGEIEGTWSQVSAIGHTTNTFTDGKHNYRNGLANRAPPYIVGLGTSTTYLFKRTLLI